MYLTLSKFKFYSLATFLFLNVNNSV